ncbi:2-phosphoglycolate phosphatase 1 [Prunus dulcis]|uniref:2-phosphoglycolate phosphatase 1 n=1 Tax=Prunus dulcis TaxID=3755 RepID=A0A4Y1R293_PRUDU|nr:2-phosphoglycolate phosphatase 1 [Prunus dulcis]
MEYTSLRLHRSASGPSGGDDDEAAAMDSDEVGVADYEFIDNDSDNSNDVASHRYQVYVIGEEGRRWEEIDLKPGFLMEHDENKKEHQLLILLDLCSLSSRLEPLWLDLTEISATTKFMHLSHVLQSSLVAVNVYVMEGMGHSMRENPGCLFIATNRDAVTHLTDAQEWAESVLAESVQNLNEKIDRIEEYNFDLHVLESKAQDAEDRLEMVASQAQKVYLIATVTMLD